MKYVCVSPYVYEQDILNEQCSSSGDLKFGIIDPISVLREYEIETFRCN